MADTSNTTHAGRNVGRTVEAISCVLLPLLHLSSSPASPEPCRSFKNPSLNSPRITLSQCDPPRPRSFHGDFLRQLKMRRPQPKSTVKTADTRRARWVGEDSQSPEGNLLHEYVERLIIIHELARNNSMELAKLKIEVKKFRDKIKAIEALKKEVSSLKEEIAKLNHKSPSPAKNL
ncbi:hypothetical protein H6P81_005689 [Aristolochia fimbriata]|uniref:Uncharacterized protein n=1 Tax=Aristolochia fimbriata TaxID=158543 RepID=A0AAV7EXC3_ARIFI|nr:hypothetical protein H6P81_005689 [Aristolochia fimbriata]